MTTTKELEQIRASKRERLALEGLPLAELAEPIEQYQAPTITTWQVMPEPEHTLTKRLLERRISPETITHFSIVPNGKGWSYTIPGGGSRWKNYDSHGSPKYAWLGGKPEGA